MFYLSKLLDYDDIVIQCHNAPDADSIASAFAVYTYLKEHGKNSKIIYSGGREITKVNLLEMIVSLSIPIEYVKEMSHIKTLVLVDCQYGEKNVEKFTADTVIVIDHHVKKPYELGVIRSELGSCSTLIWDLLRKENFDFKNEKNINVATALYYGLFTDTGKFEEINHPLDKDLRDFLKYDLNTFKKLKYNNLTLDELHIAGTALTQYNTNNDLSYATFRVSPCDPNILGYIADLALEVNGIDVCVVYNQLGSGFKLSVRSCVKKVMANEFAYYITDGDGSGHTIKAGGFINNSKLDKLGISIEEYIENRTQEYFNSYDMIDANAHNLNPENMPKYKKRKIPVGFVLSTDIFDEGTPMLIRSLEGDAEAEASKDIYLMIGILGEIYPITAEKFNKTYTLTDAQIETDFNYSPVATNKITSESIEIVSFAKSCVAKGEIYIYAMPVTRKTKVFTDWNKDGYMLGEPGDYIAIRSDAHNDVYIIQQDIFKKTYDKIEE